MFEQKYLVIGLLIGSLLGLGTAQASWYEKLFLDPPSCQSFLVNDVCLDKKQFVTRLQTRLNQTGCSVGRADGVVGPKTRVWLRAMDTVWGAPKVETMLAKRQGEDLLARVEILGDQVCKNAYRLSPQCRSAFNSWKKKPGAGAFVANAAGGCTTASGYASSKEASSAALGSCRKSGFPCKVISSTKAVSSSARCKPQEPAYRRGRKHKAIALGSGTCYLIVGARTLTKARKDAIAYCKRRGSKNCKIVKSE